MKASDTKKAGEAAPATTQKPASKPRVRPKLSITSSDEMSFWGSFRMNVLGAPESGKTHHLLTASKHYAGWPPEPGTVYDDVLIVETDSLGLAMLRETGAIVPRTIDLTQFDDAEIESVLKDIPRLIQADVEANPCTRVVGVDTMSVLLAAVINVKLEKVGPNAGPRAYNQLAGEARRMSWALRRVNVPVVFNMHVKDPQVIIADKAGKQVIDPEDAYRMKQLAAGMAGDELNMDIAGREAAKALRNHATFTWFLENRSLPGGKTERILNAKHRNVEGKMRLTQCVSPQEPAHLGQLFAKIAAGCGVPEPGEAE